MARRAAEERYDHIGPVRLMAKADGYRMVRRPGCAPYVLTDAEWAGLYMDPPKPSPCASSQCVEVCDRIRTAGEACAKAYAAKRPADLRAWANAMKAYGRD